MDAKTTTPSRLDHLDAEEWERIIACPLFALYEARIQAELERQRGACERGDTELEVRRAQGAVGSLRAILSVPRQMLVEMRQKRK